jgi:hypothetical protein
LALLAVTAVAKAHAGDKCSIELKLDHVDPPAVAVAGDRVRTRLTLGAGGIEGGTELSVDGIRFFLGCNAARTRLFPCSTDGSGVAYGGDETITTTCPVGFSTGHAAGPRPTEVLFRPSAPLSIPANSPEFCTIEFDVIVNGPSRDATPGMVEQVAALGLTRPDAVCDNGFRMGVAIMGGIRVE